MKKEAKSMHSELASQLLGIQDQEKPIDRIRSLMEMQETLTALIVVEVTLGAAGRK